MPMVQVQPGSVTGIYYILVASLPWNCTWQSLKDFARNQKADGTSIKIDHAHVYNDGTTSGWVRVKGMENFLRLKDHLQNDFMEHRSLIAEFKNEIEVLLIKDEGSLPPETSRRTRNDSSSSSDTFASATPPSARHHNPSLPTYSDSEGWYMQPYHGSTASLLSPASPTVSYYSPTPQMYDPHNQSPTYPSSDYFQSPTPNGVVYTNLVMAAPVYLAPIHPTPEYAFPTPTLHSTPDYSSQPLAPQVRTEAREIIITRLSHSTTESDLKKLLIKYIARTLPRSSMQHPPDQLEDSYLASHSDGRPKGHAFAVVKTEQLARGLVRKLDGIHFQDRTIKAHLTKEGVPPAAPQMTAHPPGYQNEVFSEAEASSQQTFAAERSPAQTATSTTSRSRSTASRKSKESLSDRKKSSSPAVVNGSFSGSGRALED